MCWICNENDKYKEEGSSKDGDRNVRLSLTAQRAPQECEEEPFLFIRLPTDIPLGCNSGAFLNEGVSNPSNTHFHQKLNFL